MLYDFYLIVKECDFHFEEITGQGIVAIIDGITVKVGSRPFVNVKQESNKLQTAVHIKIRIFYYGNYCLIINIERT
jgi:Cu+-exporting ATPase